jgi:hypothetical protein
MMWPPPPPADETELERALRLQEENVAAAKSREIDLQIEREKLEAQKNRRPIRILLLGQPSFVVHRVGLRLMQMWIY